MVSFVSQRGADRRAGGSAGTPGGCMTPARLHVPTLSRRLSAVVAALAVLLAAGLAQLAPMQSAQAASSGFGVQNGRLVDATGADFVMRGINHAHAWYPSQTSSIANIKATGANTVRVVLSGGRWTYNDASDVANVIS